jgi:hypothetical protein
MPRDGDPMSDSPARSAPSVLDPAIPASAGKSPRPALPSRRRPLRPGQRAILLSAGSARGAGFLLAFTRTRGGIAFWRSVAPQKSPLQHVADFPGPFGVRAVVRLLASGAVGPEVDEDAVADACVDGVGEDQVDLVKLAWYRLDGRVDPRAAAVLALSAKQFDRICEWEDASDLHGLLALGQRILDADREWIEKHRAEVDAEVDRRAGDTAAGEQARRAIRTFVEECLRTLGRLPRSDETAGRWDGAGLAGSEPGPREQRRLGLHQTGRVGRFRVWVHYWDGAGSIGRGEVGSGAGWYWDVTNPDPLWILSGTMGPCDSADEAWSDASCIAEQE